LIDEMEIKTRIEEYILFINLTSRRNLTNFNSKN